MNAPVRNLHASEREERLAEIERVLKFDPRHPDRRTLIREYLDLTEPKTSEAAKE